jgi:hypothetical protein
MPVQTNENKQAPTNPRDELAKALKAHGTASQATLKTIDLKAKLLEQLIKKKQEQDTKMRLENDAKTK